MGTILLVPRIEKYLRPGVPGTGSAAYQDYLAADDALVRYDKPGNTDKAIALYEKTLARSPGFALAEAGLARAYWRKYNDTADSKWADAATQASAKAMEMNPNLAAVQMTAGMIHVDQGKADLGMQELEQARQMDGHSASVYAALGEAYREAGRPGDEKAELQTAMDLAPDDWRWPYLLGALQIDTGDFAGAEQSLKTALGKTPDNARILYNLGLVYRKENRLTEAQAELEKSVALNAQTDSIMELGLVFLLEGNDRDSIGMYHRAVEMNSSDYSAWGNLAGAYQWSGQYPREATDAYKRAVALGMQEMKRTPDDSYLVSSLGSFYANLQDEAHAMPFLRKAIVLAPGDPDVVERVGESYEALGHRQEALKLIGEALRLGFSIGYAKSEPALKALRQDPGAPEAIRDLHLSTPKTGGKS
jgi:tetratricopeptide (TPR) repeat protein